MIFTVESYEEISGILEIVVSDMHGVVVCLRLAEMLVLLYYKNLY